MVIANSVVETPEDHDSPLVGEGRYVPDPDPEPSTHPTPVNDEHVNDEHVDDEFRPEPAPNRALEGAS